MLAKPRPLDRIVDVEAGVAAEAAGLDALHGHLNPLQIIERSARELFHGGIAAVSSFGADSAVLVELVTAIAAWRMIASILHSLEVPLEDSVSGWPPDGQPPIR